MQMADTQSITCDIAIIGSGFSGSLAALCLHQRGFRVALIEKKRHPRFAVGESSTPIADMVLRSLAQEYGLPWLGAFSRYGRWQEQYPGVRCGVKRGFSYYNHRRGAPFSTTAGHENELLVAASISDRKSDTHWLRADLDHFLVQKAEEYNIPFFDQTNVDKVRRDESWTIEAETPEGRLKLHAAFIIDASGGAGFAKAFLGANPVAPPFHTRSRALFSHFRKVGLWENHLAASGIHTADYPFRPDRSALHHLLGDRWLWMLRFNDGLTSAGLVLPDEEPGDHPQKVWDRHIQQYPSLQALFRDAELADTPGRLIQTGQLQRRLDRATGQGWAALPHTAGFIDPLHSTGIAHTLTGLEKLLELITGHWDESSQLNRGLRKYEETLFEELAYIDLLVAGCYQAMHDFELFSAFAMLYFVSAIRYEQQRLKGDRPDTYLDAADGYLQHIVRQTYVELKRHTEKEPDRKRKQAFLKKVRDRIAPYNTAGLMRNEARNMYHHTAARLD